MAKKSSPVAEEEFLMEAPPLLDPEATWVEIVEAALNFITDGNLKIRYQQIRQGTTVGIFRPNEEQRAMYYHILECARQGKPVRAYILKARRAGISTCIAAVFYVLCSIVDDIHALVAASDMDNREALWRIYQKFKDSDARDLKFRADNKREMNFQGTNSSITADIANADMGKGDAIQLFHGSEFAYWKDAEDSYDSVMPCVPDFFATMVFLESTGQPNSLFEEEFVRAYDQMFDHKAGKLDKNDNPIPMPSWYPFFFPWFVHREYTDRVAPASDISFDILKTRDPDEIWLMEQGATVGQIAWRRRIIDEKYRGDAVRFGKYYPATVEEAFAAGANTFFSRKDLINLAKTVIRPESRWEIELHENLKEEVMATSDHGRLRVYRAPMLGAKYVIGADAAGESEDAVDERKKSQSAVVVVDEMRGEVAACWTGFISGHNFGDLLAALGYWYNTAHLVPEGMPSAHGAVACSRLAHGIEYPRLYTDNSHGDLDIKESERLGWRMNVHGNRMLLLETFQRLVHEDLVHISDSELVSQMKSFVENAKGKIKAKLRFKDDLVIAAALALYVASQGKSWGVADIISRAKKKRGAFDSPHLKTEEKRRMAPEDFGSLFKNPVRRRKRA